MGGGSALGDGGGGSGGLSEGFLGDGFGEGVADLVAFDDADAGAVVDGVGGAVDVAVL